ncbi:MAG: maleate cis-trans isomerase family protein [Candidatus Binatia bacterium]
MFGYRARIGYISPSVIELNAYDFYRIVPKGVGMIGVACMVGGWKEDAYKQALAQVENCAKELSRRFCDFIIHGGAPLVLSQGKGFEARLIEKLQTITGVPCTTSIVAAMDAFRDLSTPRLAVVDPYPPELNEKMVGYLKEWGFDVASVVSLGTTFTESSVASIGDIYRAAKKAVKEAGNATGIFIPCANFPVVDVIEDIETDLGLPVISNITSQLYVAFKAIGMREKIEGYGRLMRILSNS